MPVPANGSGAERRAPQGQHTVRRMRRVGSNERLGVPGFDIAGTTRGHLHFALSGNVPHMPPMMTHVSPTFIHVCVIFDSLPSPST